MGGEEGLELEQAAQACLLGLRATTLYVQRKACRTTVSDSVNSLNRYAYAEYAFATNISAKRSKFKTVLACFSQTQPDLNGDTENYTGTYTPLPSQFWKS